MVSHGWTQLVLLLTLTFLLLGTAASDGLGSRLSLNTTHPTDRSALLGLLSSFIVKGRQSPLRWDASVDPCGLPTCGASSGVTNCNWEGVSCEDYRVISLGLHGRGLSGHISGHICRFDELRHIDLSGNSLTGLMPHQGACQHLPHVNAIDMSGNQLTGPLPFSFASSMPRLKMLNLSHNSFSGSIPRMWGNFSNLELIDVSRNDITGSIPETLTFLRSLKLLVLDYNCRICGQLSKHFRERVMVSTTGTNIGSWMCRFEDCHQSTSVFIAQMAVSVSAVFGFLGACFITKLLRRRQGAPAMTADAGLEKEKEMTPPDLMECVGSLVLNPGGGDQMFVALPLSQELPTFRRRTISSDEEVEPNDAESPSPPSSEIEAAITDVEVERASGNNPGGTAEDEVRIAIANVNIVVQAPIMPMVEESVREDTPSSNGENE